MVNRAIRKCEPQPGSQNRAGFTLFELLLTLTVLVAVSAIVWPSISQSYSSHLLNDSARAVRVNVVATRVRALDYGIPYEFRFEPQGRNYLVLPHERPAVDRRKSRRFGGDSQPAYYTSFGSLPEGMRFQRDINQSSRPQRLPKRLVEGLNEIAHLANQSWSAPLVFQPDGTAIDAAFEVVDSEGRFVQLDVRGLTGAVSVSPVQQGGRR